MSTEPRRVAGVLGDPIEHSLSPALHEAAFSALGLDDWSYRRVRCSAEQLPDLVDGLGSEWVGASVTMPGKRAALRHATSVTNRAHDVGAANTLIRKEGGWYADCTDVSGVLGALRATTGLRQGDHGVVLGAGGTAAAAVVAFAELGFSDVTLVVRDPARTGETVAAAERAGLRVHLQHWDEAAFAHLAGSADALISTVPAAAVAPIAGELVTARALLDVVYDPWPTPLATATDALATGLDMLLHQAFEQAEQFTGMAAPREAMRGALRRATGNRLELPLG